MSDILHTRARQPAKKKRGRPKQGPLAYARAAFWARSVQIVARKKFSELEREISPDSAKPRDGGGFSQPHAWSKYARGKRVPRPPELGDESAVFLAEALYPGTISAYSSITWDFLQESDFQLADLPKLGDRVSPSVLNTLRCGDIEHMDSNRITLSPAGYAYASRIQHFDVLGLMLMQWHGRTAQDLRIHHIFYARLWLMRASRWLFPFRMTRNLLLPLIEERVPELGLLSGPSDLSLAKTDEDIARDAYYGLLFGGESFLLPVPDRDGGFI